jgi:hypothetical protein
MKGKTSVWKSKARWIGNIKWKGVMVWIRSSGRGHTSMFGYSEHGKFPVHPEEGLPFTWLKEYRHIAHETILEQYWSARIFRQ